MNLQQIVQSSVNVIQITRLKKGDTLKMIETSSYSSSPELSFGVVIDVMNAGVKCFVEVLKFVKSYDDVKGSYKIIGNSKEENDEKLSLFPAKPEEVQDYLSSAIQGLKNSIENDEEKIADKRKALEKAEKFVSGEMGQELSQPEYIEHPSTPPQNQLKA